MSRPGGRTLADANYAVTMHYVILRGDVDAVFSGFRDVSAPPTQRMALYNELSTVPGRPLLADQRAKALLREYGFEAYWREKGWPELCRPVGADDFECGPGPGRN